MSESERLATLGGARSRPPRPTDSDVTSEVDELPQEMRSNVDQARVFEATTRRKVRALGAENLTVDVVILEIIDGDSTILARKGSGVAVYDFEDDNVCVNGWISYPASFGIVPADKSLVNRDPTYELRSGWFPPRRKHEVGYGLSGKQHDLVVARSAVSPHPFGRTRSKATHESGPPLRITSVRSVAATTWCRRHRHRRHRHRRHPRQHGPWPRCRASASSLRPAACARSP